MKLSVVVPVYNVEEYIAECINSILGQTMKDIEVIAVDDGSTDMSGKLLDEISETDSRLRVIHKENGGVTSARNAGLAASHGEYIAFADGDDYIAKDMYEILVDTVEQNDLEAAVFNRFYYVENGVASMSRVGCEAGVYKKVDGSIENLYKNVFNNQAELGICASENNGIYKKSTVLDLHMNIPKKMKVFEDLTFMYGLYATVNSIGVVDGAGYYYRRRVTSAMNSVNERILTDIEDAYLYLKQYYENHEYSEILLHGLKYRIFREMRRLHFISGDTKALFFLFPYEKIPKGSNIVLYGAGAVGKSYYKQLRRNNYCSVVLTADMRYGELSREDYVVKAPDEIKTAQYDFVLIAVERYEVAEKIEESLISLYGVEREKCIKHQVVPLIEVIEIT